MIGKIISHYKIIEKLGEGGMGIVYQAEDTKLKRTVALKFLPQGLEAHEPERARLLQEAQAAATLNHPNICTIHDISEFQDQQFIVMEYVDGQTLRQMVPIPKLQEALSLAIQIGEALQEAHSKGVIHRDVKTDNIMVNSRNQVKVMDFGLAKLKGSLKLTKTSSTVGTLAYMAPEQIQGAEVDARSDIFSYGVVLYELLTGHLPFDAMHEAAMMYAILNEEPKPISFYLPDVSSQLENLMERTLEKDPSDRYQSMEDLLSDVKRLQRKTSKKFATPVSSALSTSSATEQQPLIYKRTRSITRSPFFYITATVVMVIALVASYLIFFHADTSKTISLNRNRVFVAAFENRTGDPALDPIGRLVSDWVTQGILNNELAEVIPTTTTLPLIQQVGLIGGGLEDRTKLIGLAEATKSGILVSGMFYQIGENIQFEAQIIDVQKNDVILTLEPVRGHRGEPMKAINTLQQKIMGGLAVHIYPGSDLRRISDAPIYEAYVEFMEGIRYFGMDYQRAFEHFLRAIEIDPDYLFPKLYMIGGYGNMGQYASADSIMHVIDNQKLQLSAYQRYYLDYHRDNLQGRIEESFLALIHIENIVPMDALINYLVGNYALRLNRPGKTVETFAKINMPVHWIGYAALSWRFGVLSRAYHLLGDYQQELETAREAKQYFPNDLERPADELRALAALGKIEEMHNIIEESKHLEPTAGSVGEVMLVASEELRAHGNKAEALRIAEQAIQWYEDHDPENKSGLADVLYLAERWEESYQLYQELAAATPDDISYKGVLGTLAARKGNKEEARRVAKDLKSIDRKYLFGWHTYLRARIHALLGEPAEAVKLIQESFDQGRRFDVYIHRDIDLESLHDYPPFQELLKPKG